MIYIPVDSLFYVLSLHVHKLNKKLNNLILQEDTKNIVKSTKKRVGFYKGCTGNYGDLTGPKVGPRTGDIKGCIYTTLDFYGKLRLATVLLNNT